MTPNVRPRMLEESILFFNYDVCIFAYTDAHKSTHEIDFTREDQQSRIDDKKIPTAGQYIGCGTWKNSHLSISLQFISKAKK